MYVVKDLVPDMNNFYKQYKSIEPWLQRRSVYLNFTENNKKSGVYHLYQLNYFDLTFIHFG